MPTTSNFGWTTPADTDLVKDGAAAIRTLGNGIDTSFLDLKGGTTGQNLRKNSNTDLDFTWAGDATNTLIDAEGDLLVGDTADTLQRLAIGTTGEVLTVDTAVDGKIKWAAVPTGGMTLLSTTTLSGASTTINITPTGYNYLEFHITGVTTSSGNYELCMRVNADSGSNYSLAQTILVPTNSGTTNAYRSETYVGFSPLFAYAYNSGNTGNTTIVRLYQPNDSVFKNFQYSSYGLEAGGTHYTGTVGSGVWRSNSALTSVAILTAGGQSFNAGTVKTYGVK